VKEKIKIIAVIAAYNEEKKVANVVDEVSKYVDLVIIIDDGSKDRTAEIIKNKKTIVLKHCVNLGQGAALQTGFDYAKKFNPEVVITYDADGQFEAKEIPKIIKPILDKKVDMVLGSRFLGKTINMSSIRKHILKLGILFTWIFSEIKLTDTHNGFRALSNKALNSIEIVQNRMAHASEILDEIKRNNLSYLEVPVTVKYDDYSKQKGQSSLNSIKILLELIGRKLN
jgi:glycosyltransferase involved in cell wall biosynthesis